MSNINLKNFVNINIVKHRISQISGSRDTTILFTSEGTKGSSIECESYDDAVNKTLQWISKSKTLSYAKVYFECKGVKLKIIEGISYNEIVTDDNDLISDLDDNYICVAYAADNNDRSDAYLELKKIAKDRSNNDEIYGINEKIILAGIKLTDKGLLAAGDEEEKLLYTDSDLIKNFGVKVSSINGAEMSIAAYLSQIDVYEVNSVYDYNFTRESNLMFEDISDNIFKTIENNNMNINIELAGESVNCGGNLKDSADLTNEFVRIILHQTLTEKLLILLMTKIKSTDGLSKIYTTLSQELNNYLSNGYLTTDKIWTDSDYVISYNGNKFTIIEQGTALTNGYIIKILPISSLSTIDKEKHQTPPIYIIIADQWGIRKITINGEII